MPERIFIQTEAGLVLKEPQERTAGKLYRAIHNDRSNRPQVVELTESEQGERELQCAAADAAADAGVVQQIRDEAYRRIIAIFSGNVRDGEAKQRNLIAQATQLLKKGVENWTAQDTAAWDAGQALWDRVAALRANSNTLQAAYEVMTAEQKAEFDPTDNAHWSE